MCCQFKAIAIYDEEPRARFKQEADVIMSALNTIIVKCMEDGLEGLKTGPREINRKLLKKPR